MSFTTSNRAVIATGTGRCGTLFLQSVLECEPAVAAWHERHAMGDAFHRYCCFNGLPVDHAGFLAAKAAGFSEDLGEHRVSFEASAYLAYAIPLLHGHFSVSPGIRFILLVRRPDLVVNSYIRKGWYAQPVLRDDPALAAGYQPDPKYPHHPFSRLVPVGDDAAGWDAMTVVGKLAWFWRIINGTVLEAFGRLPGDASRIVRLEDLSFDTYRDLSEWMGFTPTVSRDAYEEIVAARPNTKGPIRSVAEWSAQETAEFESQVADLSQRLDYPVGNAETGEGRGAKERRALRSGPPSLRGRGPGGG